MEFLLCRSSSDFCDIDNVNNVNKILPTLYILFISNLWTFLLVLLPVIISFPPSDYYKENDWFTGNDVCRILEPFIYPLYLLVFVDGLFSSQSNKMDQTGSLKKSNIFMIVMFGFASVLYIQGAGLHTASNMFKNGFETFMTDDTTDNDFYFWLRTVWEHDISHYMYGTGLAIIFVLQACVYKNEIQTDESNFKIRVFVFLISIIRGLLISGACIEFPSGIIVGYIYLGLVIIWSLYHLYSNPISDIAWQKELIKTEKRPVWMSFTWSYLVAFFIIIIWSCIYGTKTRSQAGL